MINKSPFILMITSLVLVDQFLKWLMLKYYFASVKPNYGVLFGWITNPIVMIIILVIGFIALLWLASKMNLTKRLATSSLSLIFAGALSNLIDRIAHGYVVDFIYLGLWPTFNLADVYIFVGVIILFTKIFWKNGYKKIN